MIREKIPELENERNTFYIVLEGESLSSISKKLNMDINKIRKLNNFTKERVSKGDILRIRWKE